MPVVHLGNPAPMDGANPLPGGERVTTVVIPDSRSLDDAIRDVAHNDGSPNTGLWAAHSSAGAPSWVECQENPELASALAARFGCPIGRRPAGVSV